MVKVNRVQLMFEIDGKPAEYRRNPNTGRADLIVGDQVIPLQSPYSLGTHFDFKTRRAVKRTVDGHDIEVVKLRPRAVGGLRENTYTISVDGRVIAAATGM